MKRAVHVCIHKTYHCETLLEINTWAISTSLQLNKVNTVLQYNLSTQISSSIKKKLKSFDFPFWLFKREGKKKIKMII